MFIERKESGVFLAKKSMGKIFLLKIKGEQITNDTIVGITQKECDFIYESGSYNKFLETAYNEKLLRDIIYQSKYLNNILDVDKIKNYPVETRISSKAISAEKWSTGIFPKKFIYNSNNIEGSKISENEVEKIIENKKYAYKIKNEIREVENSIISWIFIKKSFLFNEIHIKKLYHMLTKNLLQENGEKYPRGFKKIANTVNNSSTTAPENVSKEINDLLDWYKRNKKNIFPLQLAFDFHLKYEQIHPFENGNGRTGRLIMNKILLQNTFLPMIVFTENKTAYFNAIASCKDGNKKKYYKFMLEQYKKTLNQIEI